jgi:prepilin-type N-terminal cleavage/methylation domain-containing protein
MKQAKRQHGFTLIEMMIATVILLVGLVGVAQLVPASIRLNSGNRDDSTALVFAQREMDELIDQPLSFANSTFQDTNGVLCPAPPATCTLGNPAAPKTVAGSPVVILNNRPVIDFSAAPVNGYSFQYTDPNDPFNLPYDVRWASITYGDGVKTVSARRFILGARRTGGNVPFLPVTLDTLVSK